jgi:hypothetical protein
VLDEVYEPWAPVYERGSAPPIVSLFKWPHQSIRERTVVWSMSAQKQSSVRLSALRNQANRMRLMLDSQSPLAVVLGGCAAFRDERKFFHPYPDELQRHEHVL